MLAQRQRVFVAGHRGMVGSQILQQLQTEQDVDLITRTHDELDLTSQASVMDFFAKDGV